jgi:hypothetical protein
MKRIIPFLFASLAVFADSQQPPVASCGVIVMESGVPVFVCMPNQPPETTQPPVAQCNVIAMENGVPVFVCMPQTD